MHKYVMGTFGEYVKKNYNPECMTTKDLNELHCLAKTMKELLEADKVYNIIEQMENAETKSVEMNMDEFIARLKDMYKNADAPTRTAMKTEIAKILV